MTIEETTTQIPETEATEAPVEETTEGTPEDPSFLGQLTPEEQQAIMAIIQREQQILLKIGKIEHQKLLLVGELNSANAQRQQYTKAVSERFNLKDGEEWVATADGVVRLVTGPGAAPES